MCTSGFFPCGVGQRTGCLLPRDAPRRTAVSLPNATVACQLGRQELEHTPSLYGT